MLDAICGDGKGANPMVLAVIAIVVAVLLFGGGCCRCGERHATRSAAAEKAK